MYLSHITFKLKPEPYRTVVPAHHLHAPKSCLHVLQMLTHNRRMQPTPQPYLVAQFGLLTVTRFDASSSLSSATFITIRSFATPRPHRRRLEEVFRQTSGTSRTAAACGPPAARSAAATEKLPERAPLGEKTWEERDFDAELRSEAIDCEFDS